MQYFSMLSPYGAQYDIILYNLHSLNQIGAVHNEREVHRHGKIYVIDFMSIMHSMLADICNM